MKLRNYNLLQVHVKSQPCWCDTSSGNSKLLIVVKKVKARSGGGVRLGEEWTNSIVRRLPKRGFTASTLEYAV